ncbi:MAG: YHS domain-containing protein [bacterium]|nr:YHS domain-containing protein [bacterium]
MSCCGNKNQEKQYDAKFQSTCPVMGSPVDKKIAENKGLTREYKGEKYYFCCGGCPEKFEKNPKSYIEKNSISRDNGGCC